MRAKSNPVKSFQGEPIRPNPNPVKSFRSDCMLVLLLLAVSNATAAEAKAAAAAPADVAASVLKLTGVETRIGWLRNKQWETDKPSVDGGVGFLIMAFDTDPPSHSSPAWLSPAPPLTASARA